MGNKYHFDVKETSYGHIEVEAESQDEAWEKVHKEYEAGNICWTGIDYGLTFVD